MVMWFHGSLGLWFSSFYDSLGLWCSGFMVLPFCCSHVLRFNGSQIFWSYGSLLLGSMFLFLVPWLYGSLVLLFSSSLVL